MEPEEIAEEIMTTFDNLTRGTSTKDYEQVLVELQSLIQERLELLVIDKNR